MLEIQLISPSEKSSSETINLRDREYSIGRHQTCGVVLESDEVSRVHARIFLYQGEYYFSDLNSSYGSRLNNQEVQPYQPHPIQFGDTISICGFLLYIKQAAIEDAASVAPTAIATTLQPESNQRWWPRQGEIEEITVRCIRVVKETADVKTFVFAAQPPILFNYKPGQFVTLNLTIDGKRVRRSYSISSTPSRAYTLEITVKRVPAAAGFAPGLVSNWLHDNLQERDEIQLSGPMGEFSCGLEPPEKLLFVSAGSGITPMVSMSRYLCDTGANADIMFFHSARTPGDIILRRELEMMAARYPNFKLAVTVTRPPESGDVWFGFTGRLDENMLRAIAPDYQERSVYVCGPERFMAGAKSMFEALGFEMQRYFEESFGGPKAKKPAVKQDVPPVVSGGSPLVDVNSGNGQGKSSVAASSEIAIVFVKSGKEVKWDGEQYILDVAEEEDINIISGCRMGSCGACKVQKLEGEAVYDGNPSGLKDGDREAGFILTCIAKPVGRLTIDA